MGLPRSAHRLVLLDTLPGGGTSVSHDPCSSRVCSHSLPGLNPLWFCEHFCVVTSSQKVNGPFARSEHQQLQVLPSLAQFFPASHLLSYFGQPPPPPLLWPPGGCRWPLAPWVRFLSHPPPSSSWAFLPGLLAIQEILNYTYTETPQSKHSSFQLENENLLLGRKDAREPLPWSSCGLSTCVWVDRVSKVQSSRSLMVSWTHLEQSEEWAPLHKSLSREGAENYMYYFFVLLLCSISFILFDSSEN